MIINNTIVKYQANGEWKETSIDSFNYLFDDNINNEWVGVQANKLIALTKKGRTTPIRAVLRKKFDGMVYNITLENGMSIKMTEDHIAILQEYKPKKAVELAIGDLIPLAECEPEQMNECSPIKSITQESYTGWVYSFETVNLLFTANGILTHI